MTSKEAAVAVWRALGSGDADRIRAVLADDAEWRAPPDNATAVALGVPHHMIGPEAIVRFILDDYPRLFPTGMHIEPISVTAEATASYSSNAKVRRWPTGTPMPRLCVHFRDGGIARSPHSRIYGRPKRLSSDFRRGDARPDRLTDKQGSMLMSDKIGDFAALHVPGDPLILVNIWMRAAQAIAAAGQRRSRRAASGSRAQDAPMARIFRSKMCSKISRASWR